MMAYIQSFNNNVLWDQKPDFCCDKNQSTPLICVTKIKAPPNPRDKNRIKKSKTNENVKTTLGFTNVNRVCIALVNTIL